MQRLTLAAFLIRYPRPTDAQRIECTENSTLIVERNTFVEGLPATVIVKAGAHAIIPGLLTRRLIVERGAVAFVDGLVDGPATVDGAIFIGGHVAGRLSGSGDVALAKAATPIDTDPGRQLPTDDGPWRSFAQNLERIDRAAFVERFPLVIPAWKISGIEVGPLALDRDAAVSGILNGDLAIRSGARSLVTGIVNGSVMVESGAVLYLDGIVQRNVEVAGAACIVGIVNGQLLAATDATICLDAIVSGGVAPAA